ncbi:hypothetical protein HDU96_000056 [Phlyctochytrium bullatum]|nr:hypothetical protein HDU96_000056 [Phlyctochytrium bullatum]
MGDRRDRVEQSRVTPLSLSVFCRTSSKRKTKASMETPSAATPAERMASFAWTPPESPRSSYEFPAVQGPRTFTEPLRIALLKLVKEAIKDQPNLMPHSKNVPWQRIVNTLNAQYGTCFTPDQACNRVANSRRECLRKLTDANVMSQPNEYIRLLGELYGINTNAEVEKANVDAEMQANDPMPPANSSPLSASAGPPSSPLSTFSSHRQPDATPQDNTSFIPIPAPATMNATSTSQMQTDDPMPPPSSPLSTFSSHRQSDATPRDRPTFITIPSPATMNATPTSLAGSKRRRSPSLGPDNSRFRWSEAMVLELLQLVHSTRQPISESDMTSIADHIRDKFGCPTESRNTRRKLRDLRREFCRAYPHQGPKFTYKVWEAMRKTFPEDEVYKRRANSMARAARSVSRPRKRSVSRRPEAKRKRSVSRARPSASETVVENEVQPVRRQASVSRAGPAVAGVEDEVQLLRRRRSVSRERPSATGVEDKVQSVRRLRSVSRARSPAYFSNENPGELPDRLRSLSRAPANYNNEENMLTDSFILEEVAQTASIVNDENGQMKPVGPLANPIQSQPVPQAASPPRSDSHKLTASTAGPTTPLLQSLAGDFAVSSNTVTTVPDPALADLSPTHPPPQETAPPIVAWTPAMDADLLRLMIEFTSNATEAGLDDVVSKLAGVHGVFVQFDQLNQRYQELELMYRASAAAGTTFAGAGELQDLLKLAFGGQTANQEERFARQDKDSPPSASKCPRSSSRTIDFSRSSRLEPTTSTTVVVRQPSVSPPVVNNDSLVPLLHQLLENQRTYMATQEQSTTVIKQLRSQIKTLEDTVKDLRTQVHRNEIRNNFVSPEPELSVEAITAAVTEALERARKANPIDMETARVFTAELRGYLERKQKTFDSRVDEMKSQVVGAIEEMERKVVKVVGKKVMEEIEDRLEGLAAKVGKDVVAVVEQKLKKMGAVRTGRD